MKEITVKELKSLMDQEADFQLVDVRRTDEYEFANLGGELITLDTVPHNVDKILKRQASDRAMPKWKEKRRCYCLS